MSIPNMFHSRWEQEQATLLHQRDMQLQRNEQVQMMYRERHLQEEMQKREEQLQREKQAQMEREREAQLHRERELQIQREQEAQRQKEIETKMQLERERQAQMQKERELQIQKEHEAQLQLQREYMRDQEMRQAITMRERERKAIYYYQQQQQQQQQPQSHQQQQQPSHPPPQYPNFFSPTQNSISNLNFSQSNNQIQQQINFFNQPNINSPSTGSSSSLNFSMDQNFNPNKVSESPSSVSNKVVSSSTSFSFPSPSAVNVSPETSTTNSLRKSSSNSFDNGFINSIVSEKGFLTSPLDSNSQFLDLENVDLNEIENNLGVKDKDSSNIQSSDTDPFPASDIGILNGKPSRDLDDPSFNSLPDNLVDFDKFPMENKGNLLTTKNNTSSEEQDFSSVLSSISYSALHNSNSKISVNDNESIDDSQKSTELTKQGTILTTSLTTTKPSFSTANHISLMKHDKADLRTKEEEDSSNQKPSIPEPMTTRSKPKQSFSSIESFLGMSDDSKTEAGNVDESLDQVKRSGSTDVQDRISVIKSVSVISSQDDIDVKENENELVEDENKLEQAGEDETDKTNDDETKSEQTKVKPLHPSMRLKKQRSLSNSTPPSTPTTPTTPPIVDKIDNKKVKGRPFHPSMRLQTNKKNSVSAEKAENQNPKKVLVDDLINEKSNILHSPKSGRYQSELSKNAKSSPVSSCSSKSPTSGKSFGGKPFHSGKPSHGGKPVFGGKPASFSGGKPASYSSHIAKEAHKEKESPKVEHTGKPLSFLKSMVEDSKKSSVIKDVKPIGRKRVRKDTPNTKINNLKSPEGNRTKKSPSIVKSPVHYRDNSTDVSSSKSELDSPVAKKKDLPKKITPKQKGTKAPLKKSTSKANTSKVATIKKTTTLKQSTSKTTTPKQSATKKVLTKSSTPKQDTPKAKSRKTTPKLASSKLAASKLSASKLAASKLSASKLSASKLATSKGESQKEEEGLPRGVSLKPESPKQELSEQVTIEKHFKQPKRELLNKIAAKSASNKKIASIKRNLKPTDSKGLSNKTLMKQKKVPECDEAMFSQSEQEEDSPKKSFELKNENVLDSKQQDKDSDSSDDDSDSSSSSDSDDSNGMIIFYFLFIYCNSSCYNCKTFFLLFLRTRGEGKLFVYSFGVLKFFLIKNYVFCLFFI